MMRRALSVAMHFARFVLSRLEKPPPVVVVINTPPPFGVRAQDEADLRDEVQEWLATARREGRVPEA